MKKAKRNLLLLVAALVMMLMANAAVASAADYQAKIGNKKYKTLQKALDSVKKGQTITVLKDVKLSKSLTAKSNCKYTIDLNRKKITADSFDVNKGKVSLKNGKVQAHTAINKGASLTIEKVNHTGYIRNDGKLRIKSGKFSDKDGTCIINYGKCSIAGGTFKEDARKIPYINSISLIFNYGEMNISGGTFESNAPYEGSSDGGATIWSLYYDGPSKLTITGGSVIAKNAPCVDSWYKVEISGGKFTNNSKSYATIICPKKSKISKKTITVVNKGKKSLQYNLY